jgi:RNA polymerase sigma-70 factor (ECF subfamily)
MIISEAHPADSLRKGTLVSPHGEVTKILVQMRAGDRGAAARLMPLVYDELRSIARAHLRRENPGHTLQPTALVHEAWLHFSEGTEPDIRNRTHFLAVAANAMRRLLIDHARARDSAKRGGQWKRVSLSEEPGPSARNDSGVDVVALHEALERLEQLNARLARVVELRFFGGLTVAEAAESLGIAPVTVEKDWTKAKAWLRRELTTR